MQEYANSCASNRALWQTRLDHYNTQPGTQRLIVQPAIEDAATDERFKSLLPLLLPVSLLDSDSNHTYDSADFVNSPSRMGGANLPLTPPSSHSYTSHLNLTSTKTNISDNSDPSTKAMRAVYHTNLLQQRHRLSTWAGGEKVGVPIPGVGGIDLDYDRRLSTPGGVL
jgi:hypothetical protein